MSPKSSSSLLQIEMVAARKNQLQEKISCMKNIWPAPRELPGFPAGGAHPARGESNASAPRATFLERGMPQLGVTIPSIALRRSRFWNKPPFLMPFPIIRSPEPSLQRYCNQQIPKISLAISGNRGKFLHGGL